MLGPDVSFDIEAIDEMNTRIDIPRLIARMREHARFGLVALDLALQSNQHPRALDIARPFRGAGIQVAIGGFHVSGCLSMLDAAPAVEPDACREMGITMFGGREAEGRFEGVLRDAADGQLQSVYNFLNDLPDLDATPEPNPASALRAAAQWATPRVSMRDVAAPINVLFARSSMCRGASRVHARRTTWSDWCALKLGARHP